MRSRTLEPDTFKTMKLFLSSIAISREQEKDFVALVGKELQDISFALIENAADPVSDAERGFVQKTRKKIENTGVKIQQIDLNEFKGGTEGLYKKLKQFDVVWFGGGYTFYLRWIMKASGFDTIVSKLLKEGVVYGGGSAGAIVAGPSLEKFEEAGELEKCPEIINEGLGLTDLIIIPHWGEEDFQSDLVKIKKYYDTTNYTVLTLTDDQAVVINRDTWAVSPSKT